jgi:hypothetical protein
MSQVEGMKIEQQIYAVELSIKVSRTLNVNVRWSITVDLVAERIESIRPSMGHRHQQSQSVGHDIRSFNVRNDVAFELL